MRLDQDMNGHLDLAGPEARLSERSRHVLHKAATTLADFRRTGSKLKTRDLVGFMLSHGARSWRASLPATHVRLRVTSPFGATAVRMRLR